MSFTTRHWNDCWDDNWCPGRTCGTGGCCKYDDVFSQPILSEYIESVPFTHSIGTVLGILGTVIATHSDKLDMKISLKDLLEENKSLRDGIRIPYRSVF